MSKCCQKVKPLSTVPEFPSRGSSFQAGRPGLTLGRKLAGQDVLCACLIQAV